MVTARPEFDESTGPDSDPLDNQTLAPDVAEQLVELLESDAHTNRIIEQIKQNPALAEAIISEANSAEYALAHQICGVEHAITMLGRRRVLAAVQRTRQLNKNALKSPAPHFRANSPSVGRRK